MHVRLKGPTARARARKRANDAAYAQTVRDLVAARDGFCRYAWDVAPHARSRCQGESEWAHFGDWKRFKTRGMRPEERHSTAGSLMLCTKHHQEYDRGPLVITAIDPCGCDGLLVYTGGNPA